MLKRWTKTVAYRSGALNVVQRLNEGRVRILMYHRFPQKEARNFERQCRFLAEHYSVVPLLQAVQQLKAGGAPQNLAVITVDDGYADMYQVAFPILQKYGLPATLFVTTGFINRSCWMPGDLVRYHFAHTREENVRVKDDQGVEHVFNIKEEHAADRLRALLKRVSNRTRARVVAELMASQDEKTRGAIPAEFEPCTWEQLRTMSKGRISIGAHTVTHPILSRLETDEEAEAEILGSKSVLEEGIGAEVETFAYPNGMPEDISPASLDCARRHFRGAVTAISGMNDPGADPHQLLRLPSDPDVSVVQLAMLMAGPLRWRAQASSKPQPAF